MAEHFSFIDPAGNTFNLGDRSLGRYVDSIDGIGIPDLDYLALRGALQHGQTYQSFFFKPRIVTLRFGVVSGSRDLVWADHQRWLQAMKPYATVGTLQLTTDAGLIYNLAVRLRSGLTMATKDLRAPLIQMYTVQFIADNPFWYNPSLMTATFTLTAFTQITWPVTFSITFGGSVVDQTQTVQTLGTFAAYPKIVLTGPMVTPTVTNQTTGEFITLNYSIGVGEVVTIDLTPGVKTVTNNSGTNLIGKVLATSNLGTWHLAAPPEAASGNNTVEAAFAGGTAASSVVLNWYDQYVGI